MIIKFPTLAVRPNVLDKGGRIEGHEHNFDHLTIVKVGAVQVDVTLPDGRKGRRIVRAGAPTLDAHTVDESCFNVPATWHHTITGLAEINEFWCIYAPRDEKGEIIERFDTETDYEWVTG